MKIKNVRIISLMLALFVAAILSGCATKAIKNPQDIVVPLPPQDLSLFVKESHSLDNTKKLALKKEYLTYFFSPFDKNLNIMLRSFNGV